MAVYVSPDGNYGNTLGLIILEEVPEDFGDWSDTDRYEWAKAELREL